VKTKNKILSCILSEKITFDENKDAAISFVTPIQILLNASKGFKRGKKEKEIKNDLLSYMAPPVDERCSYNILSKILIICKSIK
jgi:hypothetical protein